MEEFWASEFLLLRNVRHDVIQTMQDEKIDCEAVLIMTDDHLKRYLPAYGDRVALMAFARVTSRSHNLNPATSVMPPRGEGTMTIRGRRGMCGNKHAARTTRRVELGWYNRESSTHRHKQVRSVKGGGTRHLSVTKTLTVRECLETACSLFFPNNVSKLGRRVEFSMSLRDFKGDMLEPDRTLEEVFQQQHTKQLRVYLYTSHKSFTSESTTSADPVAESHVSTSSSSSTTSADVLAQSHASTTSSSATITAEENNVPAESPITTASSISNVPATSLASGTLSNRIVPSTTHASATTASMMYGSLPLSSDSDFEDAGTPTVRLRRQLLSRRQRRPADAAVHSPEESRPESMLDIMDSEDEAIERAIDASLRDMQEPIRSRESLPLSQVLEQVRSKVDTHQRQEIVINRMHVLDSAMRALRRKNFNLSARLYVKFSGEIGLDHGGPRREFFRLVLQELCSSAYFEGGQHFKIFSHSLKGLEKSDYKLIGNLVALSLVHDGPGLGFLNPALAKLMLGLAAPFKDFQTNDLPNREVIEVIDKLNAIQSPGDLDRFKVDHGDWLVDQGCACWSIKLEDTADVSRELLKQTIYYRTSAEVSQFKEGMEQVFGLWSVMAAHPEVCLPTLSRAPEPLTRTLLRDLFEPVFSVAGSNNRSQEEETVYAWETFLQDIEDKEVPVTFEDLLVFVTGAERIPPCGFATKLSLEFYSNEVGSCRLPYASTCTLAISLPRGIGNPDDLRELLVRSLKESLGFGKI